MLPVNKKLAKVFLLLTGFAVDRSVFLTGLVIVSGGFDSLHVRVLKQTIERVFRSLIPTCKGVKTMIDSSARAQKDNVALIGGHSA